MHVKQELDSLFLSCCRTFLSLLLMTVYFLGRREDRDLLRRVMVIGTMLLVASIPGSLGTVVIHELK